MSEVKFKDTKNFSGGSLKTPLQIYFKASYSFSWCHDEMMVRNNYISKSMTNLQQS